MMTTTPSIDLVMGSRLRNRRMTRGIDKATLAKAVGDTETHINAFELGIERIDPRSMLALCGALHVNIGYFFEPWAEQLRSHRTQTQAAAKFKLQHSEDDTSGSEAMRDTLISEAPARTREHRAR
ncbi:hypothetical protein GJ654_12785 [Rhodoblastus acidophilus]|uniref:HTH cro/C1-type domain-containing protein n=1 Tax=Rhodoblastus acidophilus TaxID=1074 RepID=A0A6N8DRR5_RHOAC|nr:helix-turn-helix transcriptional regulator [Rhodoblastus acidophilus]MCW2275696.1 transcriptional regulator with XRE-family HTH domain [Rhodoblastus acidophilus]MTV31861.1 hypothetical protein [Rhodoblastus acidophilus]